MTDKNRTKTLYELGITEFDIIFFPDKVIEKLYNMVILNQGTDIANKILTEVLEFKKLIFGEQNEK